jgi:hypothetical protein
VPLGPPLRIRDEIVHVQDAPRGQVLDHAETGRGDDLTLVLEEARRYPSRCCRRMRGTKSCSAMCGRSWRMTPEQRAISASVSAM